MSYFFVHLVLYTESVNKYIGCLLLLALIVNYSRQPVFFSNLQNSVSYFEPRVQIKVLLLLCRAVLQRDLI